MTVDQARTGPQRSPAVPTFPTVDVARSLESVVPADLLAEVDPALWGRTVVQVAQGLATHPADVGRVVAGHAALAARIGTATVARVFGSSADGPVPIEKDGRFKDPTWEENPVYWGLRQQYLALTATLHDLVDAAGLDPSSRERASLLADVLSSVLSPTNLLPGNPAALKRAFETGGSSVVSGFRQMLDDLATNQGRPRQVDRSQLRVGKELAATPGKVVYRNRLMELIQFEPQTDEVHEIPILVSPPWINKYYIMDLSPGRSLLEWAVQHGHTVFVISYRDPDESMADVGLDDYLELGNLAALDVVQDITGAEKVNLVGLCLGGLMATIAAAMLHARGQEHRLNSLTLTNTLLDYSDPGPVSSFVDPEIVERLERKMAKTGYLPAESMAGTFDLLRANDLIFNYVGPNWLEGKAPPAFDILAWNADSTRMPAKMHAFYLRHFYLQNELARGELELLGEHLSLKSITNDTFIVAAINDHIAPWRTSFQSTTLLGGDVTFTLSNGGHIAGVVNPPGKKAKYWIGTVGGDSAPDADTWMQRATEVAASWWEPWRDWMAERGGEMRQPPPTGSEAYPPLEDAPGSYVLGTG
ncbi:PHA/PHB synthase family protein [Actinomycetospora lemnae]|uniref:Alpha/beta fold hydrolase n=1 Tax=Actinomycetospora lemnae TaxID=3019891 RepID=A0ABT5SU37_9PSEU|nr:alpha/beta fold hydrolase [Actinomycetospora sp. DW7H6]MDD7966279.1 alpha/beta fold hydrolase [Actinomycetospora sp. DW7H6]